jgi:hypothetical protein
MDWILFIQIVMLVFLVTIAISFIIDEIKK